MKDIFVGNLDYETTEDELRQLFAAYGPVDRVRIVTDRYSGQPRGLPSWRWPAREMRTRRSPN
jgi:RNA recognition motif-containing protein